MGSDIRHVLLLPLIEVAGGDEREGKENDVQAVIGQVYGRTADHNLPHAAHAAPEEYPSCAFQYASLRH